MNKLLAWIIFLSVLPLTLLSNVDENLPDRFDEAFYQIYMHTASKDVSLALRLADSLYHTSTSDLQKVRSLMLISDMYHRLANRDSSIYYTIEAGKIADKANIYDWQARIYGSLSSQYREMGILSEGKRYLEKGLKAIDKVNDVPRVQLYKGQCHQEMGYYALEEKDYVDAIQCFKRAATYFDGLSESPSLNFILATNEERLGLCYMELDAIDSAMCHYLNALMLERSIAGEGNPLSGFIQNGLGRLHVLQASYEEAYAYLEKALAIAETTGFPHLKINVYKSLSMYYRAIDDGKSYVHYNEKYLDAVKDNVDKHRKYADNVLANLQIRLGEVMASNKVVSVTTTTLILLGGIGIGIYARRQKRHRRRFKEIINTLRNERYIKEPVIVAAEPKEKGMMPENTKQELLKKLERFESSQQFTDKHISIAVLAGKMKTNTKYLSYVINNHRNKDFNTYINELRINYIVLKMEEDRRYLNYKISYLAEVCGYSTHSQFTKAFKNTTGLSPSTFMTYLAENNKTSKPVISR